MFSLTITEAQLITPGINQDFRVEHISIEHGLSHLFVHCIYKDKKGFMWFGTSDGLNRYDGYNFVVYKNDLRDPSSLSDNTVFTLCEDSNGDLYVGTLFGGLNKFNRKKETFKAYKNNPANPNSITNNEITRIYESPQFPGILWIGTKFGGLNRFDTRSETFENYKSELNGRNRSWIASIFESKAEPGVLWLGTANELIKYDIKSSRFKYFGDKCLAFKSERNRIISIYELSERPGILWLGTENGLIKFDIKSESCLHFLNNPKNKKSLNANYITSLSGSPDEPGVLYIGTLNGGLNKMVIPPDVTNDMINQGTVEFHHYINNKSDANSISCNNIFSLFEDPQDGGIMWIGTDSKGIDKIYKSRNRFYHYVKEPGNPNSLADNSVRSIYEDSRGAFWIATGNGISVISKDEKGKKVFRNYFQEPGNKNSLSGNQVYCVTGHKDNPYIVWVGTMLSGLNKIVLPHNKTGNPKFIHYKKNSFYPDCLNDKTVVTLLQTSDNPDVLWLGTYTGGLNKFLIKENMFKHYINNPDDPNSIASNLVYDIFESIENPNILWIATGGGLCKFNIRTEEFTIYKHDPNNTNSLNNDYVSDIYQSPGDPNTLWIGTLSGGINKLDLLTGKFSYFTVDEGLVNNSVSSMVEDNGGNLWIGTSRGISAMEIKTGRFRNVEIYGSLGYDEFDAKSAFKGDDGELYFGGANGLYVFYPEDLLHESSVHPVVITDFQVFNKSVPILNESIDKEYRGLTLEKSISETSLIEIPYHHNFFSFEFAALDYDASAHHHYAYRMEGFDENWIYSGTRRYASYTNLAPGEYTFFVKASGNNIDWSEDGASIKIIIHPPWWKTWWAYVSALFIAVFVFSGSAKVYLNRQRLKQQLKLEHEYAEKKEEMLKMKSRFFANISHEFRTPLTLILGPAEEIISGRCNNNSVYAGIIKKNALRLLNLINQLLDLSRLEESKLILMVSKKDLISFTRGAVMNFESLAESRDILLVFKSSSETLEMYFDKDKMEKILTNILSNAFKFTSAGDTITVNIIEHANKAVIKIRDTGTGIPASELPKLFDRFYQVGGSHKRENEGTGIGLPLTKELVELHKGSIKIESRENEWTEVTVELLKGREHFSSEEILKEVEAKYTDSYTTFVKDLISADFSSVPALSEDHNVKGEEEKKIILIVEDNEDLRNFIKDPLKDEFQIVEASNGTEGVRKAELIIPDLIISDIMMPLMDGFQLTKILKNDDKTCHIPIILLTARTGPESKITGLESGADDYLLKPFDTRELKVRICNLIRIREKLQHKFTPGRTTNSQTETRELNDINEKFMKKVIEIIERHIAEEDFNIEEFSREVGMSKTQLHRKMKAVTGISAARYVRSYRLNAARQMIEHNQGTISEIAYSVGFSSPAYFTRCFKNEYGYPPSEINSFFESK